MIVVIFELWPKQDRQKDYFTIAGALKAELEAIDGFISVERFESVSEPGKFVSLSFWRDEDAVARWRTQLHHRQAQDAGRAGIFRDYRLRVASVIRDYGLNEREQVPDGNAVRIAGSAWNAASAHRGELGLAVTFWGWFALPQIVLGILITYSERILFVLPVSLWTFLLILLGLIVVSLFTLYSFGTGVLRRTKKSPDIWARIASAIVTIWFVAGPVYIGYVVLGLFSMSPVGPLL